MEGSILAACSSWAMKKLLRIIGLSEPGNTDNFFEKVAHLKGRLNDAYALLLSKEMLLLVDDASLQNELHTLTGLCYDIEDIVSKLENEVRVSLKMSKLSPPSDNARLLEDQLFPMPLMLENTMRRVLQSSNIAAQMTPSTRLNKSFPPRRGKKVPLVGRDEDVMAIVQELTSPEYSELAFGVSIVGMNGIGKSALAQEIFNHESITCLFPRRLWASLSGSFIPEEIGKQLVEFYKAMYPKGDAQVSNYDSLCQLLETDPWLIVLDNLSDVTCKEWSSIQSSFLPSSKGKLLITTSDEDISVVTQTTRHYLHSLSDEQCQEVILHNTVPGIHGGRCSLEEINTLAKKSFGLPLVASFMGSQLSNDNKRRTLLERDLLHVPEFQREVLPTLASAYSMLQSVHLRKCFAYFSLFPPDYQFNMEELIHLWIGEEFIQCQEESSSLEHVGRDYFQTLMRWSILQPLAVDCDGEPGYYKIHEFTHELAKLVATYMCVRLDEEARYPGILARAHRHISLSCKQIEGEYLENFNYIRTLLSLGPVNFTLIRPTFFTSLSNIRVLSLKHTDVVEIPETIEWMKLLRYLDISGTPIRRLPEAVSTLNNLQILKFRNTPNLLQLPNKFYNLIGLRYIDWDISDMRRLASLPSSIGKLTNLQKLPLFEVCEEDGYSIKELQDMIKLQGSICISNLENIKNKKEATAANLSRKMSLQRIEFQWTSGLKDDISEDVLAELRPHYSLKILQITNYGGQQFPKWLSYLHKLEAMDLIGCRSCTLLPALGHLPALKFLRIENMRFVSSFEDLYYNMQSDEQQFPELESLTLKNLPEFCQWKRLSKTCLPCLRLLAIVDCPKLNRLPSLEHLTSLVNLQIIDCAALGFLPQLPPSLMSVIITKCDLLIERCQVGGQDWSMANHIPNLRISGQVIPTLRDPKIQVAGESAYLKDSKLEANKLERQDQKTRKCSRWATLSMALNAIVRMRVLTHGKYVPKLSKPSQRATLSTPYLTHGKYVSKLSKPSQRATLSTPYLTHGKYLIEPSRKVTPSTPNSCVKYAFESIRRATLSTPDLTHGKYLIEPSRKVSPSTQYSRVNYAFEPIQRATRSTPYLTHRKFVSEHKTTSERNAFSSNLFSHVTYNSKPSRWITVSAQDDEVNGKYVSKLSSLNAIERISSKKKNKAIERMRPLVLEKNTSKFKKPSRWVALSLVLKATVRMRALVIKNNTTTEEFRKPSLWFTTTMVLIATLRLKAKVMERYTANLVNKIVPINEAQTCLEELAQFPHHLEMMLHCLLFPKEYKFEKARLVHLWVTAGFLEDKNEPMEDNGNRFFDFLLNKSFIITTTTNDVFGGAEMYKFNSMKFSSFFDELEFIKHFDEKMENANMVANRFAGYWDISLTSDDLDQEALLFLKEFSNVRSILFLNAPHLTSLPSYIFSALNCLRTLDLSCSGIKDLPSSVFNARLLSYLDLSWTLIERLPNSVADLRELKALKLEGCVHLFYLPKRMKQLTKLRHLDFDILGQLTSMPEGIGALAELRTLSAFIVGCEDGCNIKELKNMKHLSGKLCISGLENVLKAEDAKDAALSEKHCLLQLELRWSSIFETVEDCNYVEVLEGLRPYTSLEDLHIISFPGLEFPKWVGDHSYSKLVSVMLYNCENCKYLPILGTLPNLQKLEMIEMHGVKKIDDKIPFSKLEILNIDGMNSLEEWRGLNGDNFPTIRNLSIKHCPELLSLTLSPSSLEIENEFSSLPCLHVEIVDCSKLESLPEKLLSTSLQTLIIEDCPCGSRYQEGGEDRNKITTEAKVWIFLDTPTSDEDYDEDAVSTDMIDTMSEADETNNLENGFILDDDQH